MEFPKLLGAVTGSKERSASQLDLGDLVSKLDEAEKRIRGLVSSAVPEVKVELPCVDAGCFEPEVAIIARAGAAPDFAALPQVPTGMPAVAPDVHKVCGDLEVGGVADALERGERLLVGKEDCVKSAGEELSQLLRQVKAPIVAAMSSLAITVAAALTGLGPFVATVMAVLASTSGFAAMLHARAFAARGVLLEQFDAAMQLVTEAIGRAKDLLFGLSKGIVDAIDGMAEEQKPALQKVAELESALQVDIPDPEDLKKPLAACQEQISKVAKEAEEQIPRTMNDALSKMLIGKVVMDAQLFNAVIVVAPSIAVLAFNLFNAYAMLFLNSSSPGAAAEAGASAEHHGVGAGDVTGEAAVVTGRRLGASMLELLPTQDIDWEAYLRPWLGQLVVLALQVALAMLLTQSSRLAALANSAIASLEQQANAGINARIQKAVDDVLGHAFKQVSDQCDNFFPRFKELLSKLQEALELAEKANALKSGFMSRW